MLDIVVSISLSASKVSGDEDERSLYGIMSSAISLRLLETVVKLWLRRFDQEESIGAQSVAVICEISSIWTHLRQDASSPAECRTDKFLPSEDLKKSTIRE